jgi:predicted metal-binding membrane protein
MKSTRHLLPLPEQYPGAKLKIAILSSADVADGAYCVGCSWMLMKLLFVFGVMNVLWIGLLASVIVLEKVIPWARIAYLGGVVFVAAGAWLLSTAMF